ncbi:MAG TPA: Fic family protein [Actinobacteria bacterium]|nr:Fic family protein [Actinomycetota bacterium]
MFGKLGPLTQAIQKANNEYLYWDRFKHQRFPEGVTPETAWEILKLSRLSQMSSFPLKDTQGQEFSFWLPDSAQRSLHNIDRQAPKIISSELPVINEASKRKYLISSLMEEAIASSQIEGAATTRKLAKDFLRTGRKPSTRAEKMITNNYQTIQRILECKDEQLTPEMLIELQSSMTEGTIDPNDVGQLRKSDDVFVFDDAKHEILHTPPLAKELPGRIELLCEFANSDKYDSRFLHPVVKGILLHFWLAYIHPFVDGNGRTARALFYWHMLANDYWMFEYLSISRHILLSRKKYETAYLYAEQDSNDATYFIVYHLETIEKALASLQKYLAKKQDELRETTRLNVAMSLRINDRQQALVRHALKNPGFVYTVESHRSSHGVSIPTARTDLVGLVKRELLTLKQVGKKHFFIAPEDLSERISRDKLSHLR